MNPTNQPFITQKITQKNFVEYHPDSPHHHLAYNLQLQWLPLELPDMELYKTPISLQQTCDTPAHPLRLLAPPIHRLSSSAVVELNQPLVAGQDGKPPKLNFPSN
jgi:hypothetical protein